MNNKNTSDQPYTFTVNKSSWHYKLLHSMFSEHSYNWNTNFCLYWRYFFFSVVLLVVMAGILSAAILSFGIVLFVIIGFPPLILIFPFGFIIVDLYKNGIPGKSKHNYYKKPKPQSLFAAKIKAVSNKFCPEIVFKD